MSSNSQPVGTPSGTPTKGMRPEIAGKWGKFSTQEIADLKDKGVIDDAEFQRLKAKVVT